MPVCKTARLLPMRSMPLISHRGRQKLPRISLMGRGETKWQRTLSPPKTKQPDLFAPAQRWSFSKSLLAELTLDKANKNKGKYDVTSMDGPTWYLGRSASSDEQRGSEVVRLSCSKPALSDLPWLCFRCLHQVTDRCCMCLATRSTIQPPQIGNT